MLSNQVKFVKNTSESVDVSKNAVCTNDTEDICNNVRLEKGYVFECEHCSIPYASEYGFNMHLKTVHSAKKIRCQFCQRVFYQQALLDKHIKDEKKLCKNKIVKKLRKRSEKVKSLFVNDDKKNVKDEDVVTIDIDEIVASSDNEITLSKIVASNGEEITVTINKDDINNVNDAFNPNKNNAPPIENDDARKTQIKCDFCHKTFKRKTSLNQHLKIVHSAKKISCRDCDKKFLQQSSLDKHYPNCRIGRIKKEDLVCEFCDKIFHCKLNINKHLVNMHSAQKKFTCQKCNQQFYQKSCLDRHASENGTTCQKDRCRCPKCNTPHHMKRKISRCSLCVKKFRTEEALRLHVLVHLGQKPFQCSICSKKFKFARELRNHSKYHTEKQNKCPKCSLMLFKKSDLKVHFLKKHLYITNEDLICKFCNTIFDQNLDLKQHIWKDHFNRLENKTGDDKLTKIKDAVDDNVEIKIDNLAGDTIGDVIVNEIEDATDIRMENVAEENMFKKIDYKIDCEQMEVQSPFLCKFCTREFKEEKSYNRHLMLHYNVDMYACHHCDEKYASKTNYHTHVRTVHLKSDGFQCYTCDRDFAKVRKEIPKDSGSVECSFCFLKFTSKLSLTNHMKKHDKDFPYKCRDCHQNFRFRDELISHIENNLCPKPIQCEYCPRRFEKRHYAYHLEKHAAEAKTKYQCDFCSKRFFSEQELFVHLKLHTTPKPFRCSYCDKSFIVKNALNKHLRSHLKQKSDCKICNEVIYSKSLLAKHLLDHFIDRPIDCDLCIDKYSDFVTHYFGHFDEPRFHCLHCNEKFYLQKVLDSHILIHSNDVLSNNDQQIVYQNINENHQELHISHVEMEVETIPLDQRSDSYEIQMMDFDASGQIQISEQEICIKSSNGESQSQYVEFNQL